MEGILSSLSVAGFYDAQPGLELLILSSAGVADLYSKLCLSLRKYKARTQWKDLIWVQRNLESFAANAFGSLAPSDSSLHGKSE